MKVLIFGATGGTGKLVVQQALQKGCHITAFIRNPAKMDIKDPKLKIVPGDVLDQSAVNSAMPGHDAVICCLGAPATKAGQLRSAGTKNILAAMQKNGVQKFICQTSLGYGDSKIILHHTPFFFREIIVPYLLKTTFAEHELQEAFIKESNVNWTIIRPGTLTNGRLTGKYRYNFDYADTSTTVKIARADVADLLLRQLQTDEYSKKILGVSY
jgi:putative NADH-flavin reductase